MGTFVTLAWVLTVVGVSFGDVLRFSAYATLGLAVPGTLLWRMLTGTSPRPFVQDVVYGTSLAYGAELGVYAVCRAADVPRGVLVWPLVVVLASLTPRLRRRAWRPPVYPQRPSWSWTMAFLVLFTFGWIARQQWWPSPLDANTLRFPYLDEPYHLSLVAALRHAMPAELPFVAGEPLRYHWFVHADLAGASWMTGIEPIVLLERLGPIPMIITVLMGASLIAGKLARSRAAALLAPALITVLGTAQLPPSFGTAFVGATLYLSPTTTYAQALLVAGVAASLPLLERGQVRGAGGWVAAIVPLLALSGAKGTALPVLAAGYAAVILFTALLHRRVHREAAALLGITVAALLLAQHYVYGSSTQGLGWSPLAVGRWLAAALGLAPAEALPGEGVTLFVVGFFVLTQLSFALGVVGLFTSPAWRSTGAQFLVGAGAAAVGATLMFGSEGVDRGVNQVYFLRTVPLLLAVTSAWGFVLLARRAPRSVARVALPSALVAGGSLAFALRSWGEGHKADMSVFVLAVPLVCTVVVVGSVGVALLVLGRLRPRWKHLAAPVAVAMVMGLGLPFAVDLAIQTAQAPRPAAFEAPPPAAATIGAGGVPAARWLRAHSEPGDLVATNAHCRGRAGGSRRLCDARMFWLAGYSERQVLVEGWTYSPRTPERADLFDRPICCLPFWDGRTLRDNDDAFRHPSSATVRRLRDEYGVEWLVLDRRARSRPRWLSRWAERVYSRGDYEVFRIPSKAKAD